MYNFLHKSVCIWGRVNFIFAAFLVFDVIKRIRVFFLLRKLNRRFTRLSLTALRTLVHDGSPRIAGGSLACR